MPRQRRSAKAQVASQVCEKRINYASIKGDKKFQERSSLDPASEQDNAQGQHLTDLDENLAQGQSLTSALVRSNAQEASADGQVCVMSKNGFQNAPNLSKALYLVLGEAGEPNGKIAYEKYRGLFDDPDISDQRKDEIIKLLFIFGNAFYDATFAYEWSGSACGKPGDEEEIAPGERGGVVGSNGVTLTTVFNACAAE
ncbi:hypothetical protein [Palleronia abyssalis]|uniref:Uncharacterized protein n=1 Tax=Palleronia abyssalis TaxID=1501240 RepID=A0A2R8BRH3_9RHOB|nr:hypothetical protein [Palleronia abyssalis]SPJ22783.1 hypothetical protein PAA8504_00582 [Palleronia abyssalis]